jgi:dipeptidyl-peptidase-4
VYYMTYPPPWTDGHLKRVRFTKKKGKVEVSQAEDLTPTPGVHQTALAPGFSYFVDYLSTANQPPSLHLYKTDGTNPAVIEANDQSRYYQLLRAGKIPQFEFITDIKAAPIGDPSDNMPLIARIMNPPNFDPTKKNFYPALVYVYGGPNPGGLGLFRVAVNSWMEPPDLWLRFMATLGFVVFSIDNRGSNAPPRGHGFETPIYRRFGEVELKDQLAGIAHLKSLGYVDPSRIAIWGGSFGGFMALTALFKGRDAWSQLYEGATFQFQAAAAFAPVTDWAGYDGIYTERYMSSPTLNAAGYDKSRLNSSAALIGSGLGDRTPDDLLSPSFKLLLLHGAGDDNVHLTHSMQLLRAIIDTDNKCELMVYPKATHSTAFAFGNTAATLFMRLTNFFVTNLGTVTPLLPPPSPQPPALPPSQPNR